MSLYFRRAYCGLKQEDIIVVVVVVFAAVAVSVQDRSFILS
jgi:hypothetical protein